MHHLSLSLGAIVQVIRQVAQKVQPAVAEVRECIRASPVVHADETGWRQDGVNGYVWTFSTSTERYFLRRGRNKEVVDEALVESFGGVLVSGFTPPTVITMAPSSAVGPTCCGTSTT